MVIGIGASLNDAMECTHVVRGAMLSVQRLGDEHLSQHGVDAEHLVGRLIRPHSSDAVPDGDVLVLVRTDLHHTT